MVKLKKMIQVLRAVDNKSTLRKLSIKKDLAYTTTYEIVMILKKHRMIRIKNQIIYLELKAEKILNLLSKNSSLENFIYLEDDRPPKNTSTLSGGRLIPKKKIFVKKSRKKEKVSNENVITEGDTSKVPLINEHGATPNLRKNIKKKKTSKKSITKGTSKKTSTTKSVKKNSVKKKSSVRKSKSVKKKTRKTTKK